MGSNWIYNYNGNTIIVKNEKAVELWVNDQIQDRQTGISLKAKLTGKLSTGETIKVSLGGIVDVECNLFVDNILLSPSEII